MLEAIMSILFIIAWLGVVLGILLVTNTLCGTVSNVLFNKEKFSFKRLFTGIGKGLVFYISSALTCIAFTILPFINEMITTSFDTVLISNDLLSTLSSVGILAMIVTAIVTQGKNAITSISKLANATAITTTQKEDK